MTFFKLILEKELGSDLESLTDDRKVIQQREKNIYWLDKKVCSKIITILMTKFRVTKSSRDDYKEFSNVFMSTYSVPFLETFLKILYKKKDQYIHLKVQFYSMRYIDKALKDPNLVRLLSEHLEFLLFDIYIPSMFLTVKDKEDWEENPIEFIRGEEDLLERPNNLKTITSYSLQRITGAKFKIGDQNAGSVVLIKFMKHAADVLSKNVDPRTGQATDVRYKEAILHIIGCIHSNIIDNEAIANEMEVLIQKFVVPEFKNQSGFIRYRACWLFGMYGGADFSNKQIIQDATEGLYKCLLDSQLPVQVQAGIALERVLEHSLALDILRPGLEKVLETYLGLIDVIDNDQFVSALEGLIKKFDADIAPFALDLIRRLCLAFAKNVDDDEEEQNGNDDAFGLDDKQLAASGFLAAITNILHCKLPKNIIIASEDILMPVLNFTLIDDKTDDIEGGLGILSSIVYNLDVINEKMWAYFLELNYIIAGKPKEALSANYDNLSEEQKFLLKHRIDGWGVDYIAEMIPCFQNYIQKGRNVIFTEKDPYFGLTYIELLFKSIDKVFLSASQGFEDVDIAVISVLYITIIENYPREIDNLIPYFLDKVIEWLPKSKSNSCRKMFIQIVSFLLEKLILINK